MNTVHRNAQIYEPYDSDDTGTNDEDEDDEDDEAPNEDAPNEDARVRREQDPRYMILKSASMNIRNTKLSKNNPINQYADYNPKTNISSYKDLVYLNPNRTTKSSLFCLRSNSRDNSVFPSAYNFTIKLPRVYKNVTKLQLVQIGFPSNSGGITAEGSITSSLVTQLFKEGISPCCVSTCIAIVNCQSEVNGFGIVEQGRINDLGQPLMVTIGVPDGVYGNTVQLANELTYQANNTPPFNIISSDSFRDIFMNTRDISVLFNEPGDCFYSKTTNRRYGAHSKENIMNTYYTQQHIDSFYEITEKIAFNAYYYPILKELLATQRAKPFLNIGSFTYSIIENKVMSSFDGLDSDIYYQICQLNQVILDYFRRTLTFELRNINKYQWIYNESLKQFTTIHDSLHASLQNDINKQFQTISNYELSLHGLNANSFKTLKTSLIPYQCIFKHLETNLSSVIGNYHLASGYRFNGTHSTIESTFQMDLHEDEDFTSMFCYHSTIGRIYGNYAGVPMNFTNFSDYHSSISNYYTIIQSTNNTISSINGTIANQHYYYVSTKYTNILPHNVIDNKTYINNKGIPVQFINNQRFYIPGQNILPANTSAPVMSFITPSSSVSTIQIVQSETQLTTQFGAVATNNCAGVCFCDNPQCCQYCNLNASVQSGGCDCQKKCCAIIATIINRWYSCLPTETIINTVGYKLGIIGNTLTSGFKFTSTINAVISTGTTNLFMSINEEMGFNNLDIAMPEDYAITNDTTGQVKLMFAKIIMKGIGAEGESNTLFQNPLIFETPLGKLDRLTFKIYKDDLALTPAWLASPFPQIIEEWNAIIQIDEEVGLAGRATGWGAAPTLPIPSNPNQTSYLNYTSKNNPNNAPS